ncbi:GTP-binding protein [Clostridium sp. Marseille-Q2269]|uniref:GTP-binding protein n=1 Tax=Clostridium sp. Marseille-Q2269 TaxID=2942205 RepID=UPI0020731C45|nr:GTP-binding protein [Clostridium sp. Marseille-Q2269]
MKSDVEIVTGFIGSGKTSFINLLVDLSLLSKENILIICCENGNKSFDNNINTHAQIVLKFYPPTKILTEEYIKNMVNIYNPHRIIIEFNGTQSLTELLNTFGKKSLKKQCKITTIYHIADAKTFNIYFNNMLNMIIPSIQFSNLILINNANEVTSKELETIESKINIFNPYAYLAIIKQIESMRSVIDKMNILDNGLQKRLRVFIKNLLDK